MPCCICLGIFRTFWIFSEGFWWFSCWVWTDNEILTWNIRQINFMQKSKALLTSSKVSETYSSSIHYYGGSICKRSWVGIEPGISYKWCISLISIAETSPCADLCLNASMWDKGPHKEYGYHVVVNQLCSLGSHSKHLCHIVDSSATCSWQGDLAHSLCSILDLLQSCPVLAIK